MKKRNTFFGIGLLVALLVLGIGYAAISNITLNIGGTGKAGVSDSNFKVKFVGTPTVSNEDIVKATITSDLAATINVESLVAKGDSVTATYEIQNVSADLSASLAIPTVTNSNTEYFSVTTDMDEAVTLASNEKTTITVTVELIKTPIDADQETTINVSLVASPLQPATN